MSKIAPSILVVAVIVSLAVGGIAGFFLGIVSTKAGKAFIRDMVEDERNAEVSQPAKLVRDRFELQYPSNWEIDTEDEDHDPDHMFSIDSPGSAFVMIVIGDVASDPEDNLQTHLRQFEKLMSNSATSRFDRYGGLTGKGATLKGRIMGIRTTVRLFACQQDDLTILITQQCPDEDFKQTQGGFSLIEKSFVLKNSAR
jgi:hypothetical protein